jgi:hypothetical protein
MGFSTQEPEMSYITVVACVINHVNKRSTDRSEGKWEQQCQKTSRANLDSIYVARICTTTSFIIVLKCLL